MCAWGVCPGRARGACAATFSFSKNFRDLKKDFFKVAETFLLLYIKEQLSKIKFKIRICLVFFFYLSKWQKTGLNLKNSKTFFKKFLFIFSF